MLEFTIITVPCKCQSVSVTCYYAVHNVMPAVAEKYDVAFADRIRIAGRQLYSCPAVSYERTHTVPFDAHNDILPVCYHLLDLSEEYVVVQYLHRNCYYIPKTVRYDSSAASASGRHSR